MKFQERLIHLNCFYNGSSSLSTQQSKGSGPETNNFVMLLPILCRYTNKIIQNRKVPAIEHLKQKKYVNIYI